MIPGSGISSKSPGYVPANQFFCGRRQVTKLHKNRIIQHKKAAKLIQNRLIWQPFNTYFQFDT